MPELRATKWWMHEFDYRIRHATPLVRPFEAKATREANRRLILRARADAHDRSVSTRSRLRGSSGLVQRRSESHARSFVVAAREARQ